MNISPIKIDVSKLSYPLVVMTLSPFLPGGVLLLGVALAHFDWLLRFFQIVFLGYYSKVFCVLFCVYIGGWLLIILVEVISSLFWIALNFATRSSISRWISGSYDPSQGQAFRKAASQFLGKASPVFLEHFNPHVEAMKNIPIDWIKDPAEKAKAQHEATNRAFAVQLSDSEWRLWYWAFKKYFGLPTQNQLFAGQVATMVKSLAWAGIIAMVMSGRHEWFLYLTFSVCIFVGLAGCLWNVCLSGGLGADVLGSEVTAALLREIVSRSRGEQPPRATETSVVA